MASKVATQLPQMDQKRQKGYASNISGSTRLSDRANQHSAQPQSIQSSQRASDLKQNGTPSLNASSSKKIHSSGNQIPVQQSHYSNEMPGNASSAAGTSANALSLSLSNRHSSRQKQRSIRDGRHESTGNVSYERRVIASDSSNVIANQYRPTQNGSHYNSILLAHSQNKGMPNEQRVSQNIIVQSSKRTKSKTNFSSLQAERLVDNKGSTAPQQQMPSGAHIHNRKSSMGALAAKGFIQVSNQGTPGPSGLKKSGALTAAHNSPKGSVVSYKNLQPKLPDSSMIMDTSLRQAQPARKGSLPQNLIYKQQTKNQSLHVGTPSQHQIIYQDEL